MWMYLNIINWVLYFEIQSKRPCKSALSINFDVNYVSNPPFPDFKVCSTCLLYDCKFEPLITLKKSQNNEMKTTGPNACMCVQIYS